MLSNVQMSLGAVEVNFGIMRTFVRQLARSHDVLAPRVAELEDKTEAVSHDTFCRNARNQLRQVFDAPRELMKLSSVPAKRSSGYVTPESDV